MSAIGLVVAIALPISLVLFGLVLVGRRQQIELKQRAQARAIKQALDDLLEALEFLIQVDDFKDVQLSVLERIEQIVDSYHQALPKKDKLSSRYELDSDHYRQRIENFKSPAWQLSSDREIRYARRQFSRVLKSLKAMTTQKLISNAAAAEYHRYLRLTLLEKEVATYTAQGDEAATRSDPVTASNYYRAAKKLLIEFDIKYPEKNQRIRELSQRTAALYENNGNTKKGGALSRALELEESKEAADEFGLPASPSSETKQKF